MEHKKGPAKITTGKSTAIPATISNIPVPDTGSFDFKAVGDKNLKPGYKITSSRVGIRITHKDGSISDHFVSLCRRAESRKHWEF